MYSQSEPLCSNNFFAERGAVGGHIYQPNVNHCIMNFENISATRIGDEEVVVKPMLRSMIFNKGKSSFSTNSTMRVFPMKSFKEHNIMQCYHN